MGVQDAYQSEEETNSSLRAESSGSRESIHYSCEDIDAPEDEYVLTKNQKHTFFRILKRLLEDSGSLKDGKEGRERQSGKILKLMYMTHRCEINILDSARHRLYREIVPTQDIYLKWCGDEYAEPLHMENLKEVHNELRFLRILKEKVDACFSKAINEFVKEFECVQKNTTLKLICDEFILTFVSGEGKNVAIVVDLV